MKKTTGFLLASLVFVTLAAVLAITLTAKRAEKRRLASATENILTEITPTPAEAEEKTPDTEEYESSTRELLLSDLDIYDVENSTFEVFDNTTDDNIEFTTLQTPTPEEIRCSDLTGKFVNAKFVGLEVKYDLEKILEMHGGAPGKVNVTWIETEDPPINNTDIEIRPLPDADEEFWIYRYVDTDDKTYVRVEYAVRRFSRTPKAFLEIRGDIFFTPNDYCGNSRRASYLVDDRGFTFEVSRESCSLGYAVVCAAPKSCTIDEDGERCAGAPSHELQPTSSGWRWGKHGDQ